MSSESVRARSEWISTSCSAEAPSPFKLETHNKGRDHKYHLIYDTNNLRYYRYYLKPSGMTCLTVQSPLTVKSLLSEVLLTATWIVSGRSQSFAALGSSLIPPDMSGLPRMKSGPGARSCGEEVRVCPDDSMTKCLGGDPTAQ